MPIIVRGNTGGTEAYLPVLPRRQRPDGKAPGHSRAVAQDVEATPTPWPTPTPTLSAFSARVTTGRPGLWGRWGSYLGVAGVFLLSLVGLVVLTYRAEVQR